MTDLNDYNKLSETFYGEYYNTLNKTTESFIEKLLVEEKKYKGENRRFPVEHYKSRIKSPESVKKKLEKLGFPSDLETAKKNLFDLAGVRLVCRFFYEVYETVGIIRNMNGIEIINIKDYVKNPKPNGYRSVHIILRASSGEFIEVQIRTIAMDFWASLEHELKYKKHVADAKIMSEELKRCADEIISVDLKMQTIYEWIEEH